MIWLLADGIVYQHPWAAIFLLAAPLILILYWRLDKEKHSDMKSFLGNRMVQDVDSANLRLKVLLRAFFLSLAWMSTVITLMQPEWHRVHTPSLEALVKEQDVSGIVQEQRRAHDIIFFLDTSASMMVADTSTGQTRLEQAKAIIGDTLARLPAENVGLYTFTIDMKPLVPPTLDHLYLRMQLRNAVVNDTGLPGTDFARVFSLMRHNFWSAPSDKFYSFIFLTDGGDTRLELSSAATRVDYEKAILKELQGIDHSRIHIYTIGMGSSQGLLVPGVTFEGKPVPSALMSSFLQNIAHTGKGGYFQANDRDGLELGDALATRIIDGVSGELSISLHPVSGKGASATKAPPPIPVFPFFLALSIILMVIVLLLPEGVSSRFPQRLAALLFMALSPSLFAVDDPSFYVEARQYEKALHLYQAMQQESFESWQHRIIDYNIGVILLQQGHWEEAVKAFQAVNVNDSDSPLLRVRYYYNLALSLFEYAQTQESQLSPEETSFIDRFQLQQLILQKVMDALEKAQEADCELQKIEGARECHPTIASKDVRARVIQMQGKLNRKDQEYQVVQLSVAEKAAKLLISLRDEEAWLMMVGDSPMDFPADVEQMKALTPLWNSFRVDEIEDHQQWVDRAFSSYRDALTALQNGNSGAAQMALRASSSWLRAMLYSVVEEDELTALLQAKIHDNAMGQSSTELDDSIARQMEKLPNSIKNARNPNVQLTLYRIKQGRYGAIIADIWENPKKLKLLTYFEKKIPSLTNEQLSSLQKVLSASPQDRREALQNMALVWDVKGFIRQRLNTLIQRYILLLQHRTLNEDAFEKIAVSISDLKNFLEFPDVTKVKISPVMAEALGIAMSYQSLGQEALKTSQLNIGRIFFSETLNQLKQAYFNSFEVSSSVPAQLMRRAVVAQRHAMQLVSQVMQLPSDQRSSSSLYSQSIHDAMRQTQKTPLLALASFVPVVMTQQKRAFEIRGKREGTCQKSPWDEVIPLYFLGENAAQRAGEALAQGATSLSNVLDDQKVAYRKWLKALELLKDGKSTTHTNEAQNERIPGVPAQSLTIEDTLKLLQQMDRDDRQKEIKSPVVKGGDGRPW